jgi:hypothetical protein
LKSEEKKQMVLNQKECYPQKGDEVPGMWVEHVEVERIV